MTRAVARPARASGGECRGSSTPSAAGPPPSSASTTAGAVARTHAQRGRGELGQPGRGGGELDDRGAVARRRRGAGAGTGPPSSSLRSGPRRGRAARGAGLVDRGARQAEHDVGGEPVAELGVDVVGAEHALGQLGPGVRRLVGEPGAAEDGEPVGTRSVETVLDQLRGRRHERVGPATTSAEVAPSRRHQRLAQAGVAVRRLEAEAALVAEPAPVDRRRCRRPGSAAPRCATTVDDDAAADRAAGAGRLDLLEVPRAGLEAVGLGGERADRADLHGVAAEVGRERVVGEGVDLRSRCRGPGSGSAGRRPPPWRSGCSDRRGCSARGRGSTRSLIGIGFS